MTGRPERVPVVTAVSRVQAYVDAATLQVRHHTAGMADSFEIAGTWSPVDREIHDLTLGDLRAVLAIIADLCPEHDACAECDYPLCDNCFPDRESAVSDDDRLLCLDCDTTERAEAEEYQGTYAHIFDRHVS